MRILHVAEAAGGVDRYLRMLLPRLRGHGFSQVLLCSQNYNPADYEGSVDRVATVRMEHSLRPNDVARCVRAIRAAIRNYKPDVVYCHSSFAGGFGRLACVGMGVKVVYNPHGWAFDMRGSRLKRLVYLAIERMLSPATDRFVLISNAEMISAIAHHVAPRRKMQVVFNGIDFDELRRNMTGGNVSRQKLGIPDDACVIGMVGRITRQKAPDTFVRMAAKVAKTIPSAHFMIVGDGEQKDETVALAHELGIADRLHITGWVNNPIAYTALMDYAVLLSRWEGFGLVVAEYMFARKPVVATAVDAIPDLITHGVNGLLVPVDDAESAAAEIVRLHRNKELREQLTENAYNKTVACYDVNRVATEHINLMKELIKVKTGGVKCNCELRTVSYEGVAAPFVCTERRAA